MKPVDKNIWRGPHADPGWLASLGFTATLDLESGAQVYGDGNPLLEAIDCDARGIRWALPLGAILPPTKSELYWAASFLSARQEKIYVHCKWGKDRTGMVVAAYRVFIQNWTPLAASQEAIREGMHFVYWWWLINLWRLNEKTGSY